MNLTKSALLGGSKRRFDLGRVVPVIIEHTYATGAAAQLKTAIDAAKLIERGANGLGRDVQSHPHRNSGGRVQNIVEPRDVQGELAQIFLLIADSKTVERL